MTTPGQNPFGDFYERQVAKAILIDPTARSDLTVAREFVCKLLGCSLGEVEMLDEGITVLAEAGVRVYDRAMAEAEKDGKAHRRAHPKRERSSLETAMIRDGLSPRLLLNGAQRLAVRYAPRFRFLVNELLDPPDDP
ncbi:MAG TPA: hypothetical protein VK507_06865 [Iamia sp.]|nr:hypothetical protein [Iamia sp.]